MSSWSALPEWKKNLVVMWFAQVMGMSAISGVFSFLPLYIAELGVKSVEEVEVWSGILMGVSAFFAGIFGPYWGALGDRKGRKLMVERVMLMLILVLMGMSMVTNVYQLLALRIVQGIFGGFTAAALALVTSVTPEAEVGFTMGVFQTAMIGGGAFGPLVGGWAADHFGYRMPFVMFSLLCLVALLTVRFLIAEKFTPVPQSAKRSIFQDIQTIVQIPGIRSMLLVLFLIQFAMQVISPVLPLYIQSLIADAGYVATISGLIIAAAGLTSSISSISMGRLGKRFRHRQILIVAAACAAGFFVLQAISSTIAALGSFRAVSGFFLGAMIPSANTIITYLIPAEKRGVAYGVTSGASLLGTVIGPLSGGFIALHFGLPAVFWVTAVLFSLTAVWVGWKVRI